MKCLLQSQQFQREKQQIGEGAAMVDKNIIYRINNADKPIQGNNAENALSVKDLLIKVK